MGVYVCINLHMLYVNIYLYIYIYILFFSYIYIYICSYNTIVIMWYTVVICIEIFNKSIKLCHCSGFLFFYFLFWCAASFIVLYYFILFCLFL